jgi:hypothetical protein
VITGQITEAEYIAAHHVHRRKVAVAMNIVMAVLVVVGIGAYLATSQMWAMIVLGGGVGGLIGEFLQSRFFYPRRLRRILAQTKGRVDLTYSWDDEKIYLSSERGQVARPWNEFPKARENDQVILIYYNDALFEILSKRWFPDQAKIDEFNRHLRFVK